MHAKSLVPPLVALALVSASARARAAPDHDGLLAPVEVGYMSGVSARQSGGQLHAPTIGTGIGWASGRMGLMVFGRVAAGRQGTRIGWGGLRGFAAVAGNEWFAIGPDLAVSAGAGRDRGRKTGLLAAVEPGVSVRFLTEKAGTLELEARWYQPLAMRKLGWQGAAMLSIAWHPFFSR